MALTAPKYLVSSSKDMVPLSDVLTFFAMAVAAGNILIPNKRLGIDSVSVVIMML